MSAYAVLPLTTGGETLIDLADLEWASGFAWRKSKSAKGPQYAVRSSKGRTYFLHRELLDVRPGLVVDHINRDPLDNRRANLRICSVAENNRNMPRLIRSNTSGYRGVSLSQGRWVANIMAGYKQAFLGVFADPADAARAYDKAAMELHGDFATLNFGGDQQ